jgi:hypothetical protein
MTQMMGSEKLQQKMSIPKLASPPKEFRAVLFGNGIFVLFFGESR